ncbi:vanin-like protein 1 [Nilaparvata lugens]|uniref:vanin-like protein 1 n=1 Tax=Nilaparvata lugens TaxID=108931 RepID=UPI00193DE38D|nr:vanin-like protein 1 [Nilaparvata lugens]
MLKCQAFLVLFFQLIILSIADQQNETYTAAVIEFNPHKFYTQPEFAFYLNIEQYARLTSYLMQSASKKPDLLVFPETGLQGDNDPFPLRIPRAEDHVVACHNDKYPLGLKTLSCIALDAHVYLVVNLAEADFNSTSNKTKIYSTTIAFNRGGELIAKYRKYNALDKGVDSPNDVDYSFFLTDFGVTFGILAGEDLLFKEPGITLARSYKIKHFVHPSKWYSELPFLTANQVQWAWSHAMNSVLISAGYNDPEKANGGSGIYKGLQGPLEYSLTEKSESFALIAEIPKDTYTIPFQIDLIRLKTVPTVKKYRLDAVANQPSMRSEMSLENIEERLRSIHENANKKVQPPPEVLEVLRDDVERYSTLLIKPTVLGTEANLTSNSTKLEGVAVLNKTLCQDGFCCSFTVMMTTTYTRKDAFLMDSNYVRGDNFGNYRYRLAVFNGRRKFGSGSNTKQAAFQICGIIPCMNDSVTSCALRTDNLNDGATVRRNYTPFPMTLNGVTFVKTGTKFNSIVMRADVSGNDTSVFPNILLGPNTNENFGLLLDSKSFLFTKKEMMEKQGNKDVQKLSVKLSVTDEISNLASASIFARVYSLDNGKSSANRASFISIKTTLIGFLCLLLSKYL